jgi:hypothetical protein
MSGVYPPPGPRLTDFSSLRAENVTTPKKNAKLKTTTDHCLSGESRVT